MVMPRVLSCIRRACEYLLFPGDKVAEAFSAALGLRAQFCGHNSVAENVGCGLRIVEPGAQSLELFGGCRWRRRA
jgi:hypothetical protein